MYTTQILERTRMCQTSGTRRVTNFTNSVKSREGEKKNKIVTMTNLKHPLSSVTQIFRNNRTESTSSGISYQLKDVYFIPMCC
jgi:hypothetical protein